MQFTIKNELLLRKLLYLDAFLGGFTGIGGIVFVDFISKLLGLGQVLIIGISVITFCYSLLAFFLVFGRLINIKLTRILIKANWLWAFISILISYLYLQNATLMGKWYLILQIFVVAGLAYLEGNQIVKKVKYQ